MGGGSSKSVCDLYHFPPRPSPPHEPGPSLQEQRASGDTMRLKEIQAFNSPHTDTVQRQEAREKIKERIRKEKDQLEELHDKATNRDHFEQVDAYAQMVRTYHPLYSRFPGELVDEVLQEKRHAR